MVVTLTDANFDALILNSDKLSIVDFWATWCPPCVAIAPTMEALAKEFEGKTIVGKLNVDDNPNVSIAYGATNLPVVLFILNGKMVDKQVGAAHKAVYEKKVRKILEG